MTLTKRFEAEFAASGRNRRNDTTDIVADQAETRCFSFSFHCSTQCSLCCLCHWVCFIQNNYLEWWTWSSTERNPKCINIPISYEQLWNPAISVVSLHTTMLQRRISALLAWLTCVPYIKNYMRHSNSRVKSILFIHKDYSRYSVYWAADCSARQKMSFISRTWSCITV